MVTDVDLAPSEVDSSPTEVRAFALRAIFRRRRRFVLRSLASLVLIAGGFGLYQRIEPPPRSNIGVVTRSQQLGTPTTPTVIPTTGSSITVPAPSVVDSMGPAAMPAASTTMPNPVTSGLTPTGAEPGYVGGATWALREVSADGRTLTIGLWEATCERFERVELVEGSFDVRLTVVMEVLLPPVGSSCPSAAFVRRTSVMLGAPLGDRVVVGGCVSGDPSVRDSCRMLATS